MSKLASLRYLLLQVRNVGDPIIDQEAQCFAAMLGCDRSQIEQGDLLAGFPNASQLRRYDAVLFGGSGDYSAAGEGAWLERILDGMRELAALKRPTFASCWGFQALARALGGQCVHDAEHAELGTIQLALTPGGVTDPVFGGLPERFLGLAGHEDRVTALPPGALLLASSALVAEQAFTLPGAPIYATQFHPELTLATLLGRLRAYPRYVEQISGMPLEEFAGQCRPTPEANTLLRRFAEVVFG